MGRGRGWEGAVLTLLRAKDFTFTVTAVEDVTDDYRRLRVTDGGMLAATGTHPTMWVRLWFDAPATGADTGGRADRPHQRAFTLVDPDPATGTLALEFALHEGRASDWARAARPGDTVEATVQGTRFDRPDPAPSHVVAVGDPASLPAVNSLLDALGTTPATVWLEGDTDGLPLRAVPDLHDVRRVPREDAGARLVAEVTAGLPALLADEPDPYVWIACDTTTTRVLAAYARKELRLPKQRVHALGYWLPT